VLARDLIKLLYPYRDTPKLVRLGEESSSQMAGIGSIGASRVVLILRNCQDHLKPDSDFQRLEDRNRPRPHPNWALDELRPTVARTRVILGDCAHLILHFHREPLDTRYSVRSNNSKVLVYLFRC
jgi:hypothetical protein